MRKIIIPLLALLLFSLLLTSCYGGDLSDEEVIGDYGYFECESGNYVATECPYVTIGWEITDPVEGIVSFSYSIEDDNIVNYDEDFWEEYHEAGFENPEDALQEYFDEVIEDYKVPPEGSYEYVRSEKKLVSKDYEVEYYKKD